MIRRSVLSVVAVLMMVLGVVLVSTSAGATTARSLPAGDAMYAVSCNGPGGQLSSVDPASAAFTAIGVPQNIDSSGCAYGMAYNFGLGKSYLLAGNLSSGEWPIVEVNLANGNETEISRITINGSPTTGYPAVMTIDASGSAFAIVANNFYALDIATGIATLRGPVGNFADIYALAPNPNDGRLYAVSESGQLLSIDPSSGAGTSIANLHLARGVFSLQFDSDGYGWLNTGVNASFAISSFDLADPQGTLVESSADATWYSGAYLIVPGVAPTPPPTTSTTVVTTTTASASDPVVPVFTG